MPIKPNKYVVEGAVVKIDISTRKYPDRWTVIDLEDLGLVLDGRGRWFAAVAGKWGHVYASRHEGRRTLYLHRKLFSAPLVDHVDHDTLNNRRENLRGADKKQNQHNSVRHADSRSPFKGVTFRKDTGKWSARIMKDGRATSLGCFDRPEAAAAAYDVAAVRLFGSFARTNGLARGGQ